MFERGKLLDRRTGRARRGTVLRGGLLRPLRVRRGWGGERPARTNQKVVRSYRAHPGAGKSPPVERKRRDGDRFAPSRPPARRSLKWIGKERNGTIPLAEEQP